MAGRPPKEKSFANMLKVAISEATEGGGTKLRDVANALVAKAIAGDVQAIREVADRLDGKPAQAIIGGDDDDNPISISAVVRKIIDPKSGNSDGSGLPAAP
jgi:hypothetical protein